MLNLDKETRYFQWNYIVKLGKKTRYYAPGEEYIGAKKKLSIGDWQLEIEVGNCLLSDNFLYIFWRLVSSCRSRFLLDCVFSFVVREVDEVCQSAPLTCPKAKGLNALSFFFDFMDNQIAKAAHLRHLRLHSFFLLFLLLISELFFLAHVHYFFTLLWTYVTTFGNQRTQAVNPTIDKEFQSLSFKRKKVKEERRDQSKSLIFYCDMKTTLSRIFENFVENRLAKWISRVHSYPC